MDTVKVSELAALKECGKRKFDILKLSLKCPKRELNEVSSKGWHFLAQLLKEKKDIKNGLAQFVEQAVSRDWYQFDISYAAAKDKLFSQLYRMGNYLVQYIGNDSILSANWNYKFPLKAKYRGATIKELTGAINIIIKRNDYIEGIIFSSGSPTESANARKPENLPENSLEIACAYAGLSLVYGSSNIKISKCYLKSKDDRGTTYAPYEERRGKNIVSVTFNSGENPVTRIAAACKFTSTGNCADCIFNTTCHTNANIRMESEISAAPSGDIKLSDAQKKIINFKDGYMNIEAVPGAGKTFCLVKRLEQLIHAGIKPSNILMVTFTNKACMEIKSRVAAALGTDKTEELPNIQTFNGLGYSILRENSKALGGNVRLASDVDKKSLTEKALKICADNNGIFIRNTNYSDLYSKYGLIPTVFRWFKSIETIGEQAFAENNANKDVENILKVHNCYQKLCHEGLFIDYDDQIEMVNELFQSDPFMALKYINRYKYIMVDEYQDINEAQFKMIHLLSGKGNLVVVGDCDQSIYKFRGGSPEFSLNFRKYFPEAETVFMTDNYRCTDSIVSVANELISGNQSRYKKEIVAHKAATEPVILYHNMPENELAALVHTLEQKYLPGEIAVISRNNAVLNRFGRLIAPDGSLQSKDYIIQDSLFNAIYTCMGLFFKNDDEILYRALIYAGADKISIVRRDKSISLYKNLVNEHLIPDFKREKSSIKTGNFLWNAGVKLGECLRILSEKKEDISEIFNQLCAVLYGFDSHPVLSVLSDVAEERNIQNCHDMFIHMTNMVKFEDDTRVGYTESSDRINVLTAHDSKGKEFKCVILYGVDEFEPDEEDRRLLYVGFTRAKEKLIIVQNSESQNMVQEFRHCCRELDYTENTNTERTSYAG